MSAIFPLGSFTQGRRAWAANGLMVGNGQNSTSNDTCKITLNNNTQTGTYIAVYGVLAFNPTKPNLCQLYSQPSLVSPQGQVAQQVLVPGMPAIDGYIAAQSAVFAADPAGVIIFAGDGINWLTMDDCPICVLPPGYSCAVRQSILFGNAVHGLPLSVTFVWGIYQTPKAPQTTAPTQPPVAQEPTPVTPTPPETGPAQAL